LLALLLRWFGVERMRRNLFWLNDDQWRQIEPHLPQDVRGKERVDDRRVISGILHVLKSKLSMVRLPTGIWPVDDDLQSLCALGRTRGVEGLFHKLAARGRSTSAQMIDSTHIKANRSSTGGHLRSC
jgi:transposase